MSEEDTDTPEEEQSEQGLLGRIGSGIGLDIDRIRAEIEGEGDENTIQRAKGPVSHPTDDEVLEVAVEALIEDKQREQAARMDNPPEDYREIPVELDIDDPLTVVHEFSKVLAEESEDLLGYLYQNSLFDVTGPSLEEDDEELFTYIIEEREDDPRPAAFLGGAQPLRINLANREGLTDDEAILIRYAHVAAARKNGYDRHILLDEVLVVPTFDLHDSPYA